MIKLKQIAFFFLFYEIVLSEWAGGKTREYFSFEHDFLSSFCSRDTLFFLPCNISCVDEEKKEKSNF